MSPTQEYNATVIERTDITPDLMILRLQTDGKQPSFTAGQYIVLGLKAVDPETGQERMIQRAYSIASPSTTTDHLEFYLSLVPGGQLTPKLFTLEKMDRLYVAPKAVGLFTLDRIPEGIHALLVATGTGLAPYMSMVRSQLVCGGARKFVVLHGARHSWDLGYRDQLEELSRQCTNLIYLPAITRPKEDTAWNGLTGYLQEVLVSGVIEQKTGLKLTPQHFHVFLCGNPAMIEASRERLLPLGFTPDQGRVSGSLHTEEYW